MKGPVRLIKRGANTARRLEANPSEELNSRQRTREIVSTVKGWIAELEQRQRRAERASSALLK